MKMSKSRIKSNKWLKIIITNMTLEKNRMISTYKKNKILRETLTI